MLLWVQQDRPSPIRKGEVYFERYGDWPRGFTKSSAARCRVPELVQVAADRLR